MKASNLCEEESQDQEAFWGVEKRSRDIEGAGEKNQ